MSDAQIIFHHYPQSPVSEKIRIIFGFKGLSWQSVIIPRLPPKPNLTALTGGYRLTPVMQIGADIYCDTACIIDEIERRFPTLTLFSAGNEGHARGLARWTDGPLFQDVVTVALVEMSPNMPPEFLADRGPLYFGPDFSLEGIKARYGEALANIRTQFGWIDGDLAGRDYLAGEVPGLADALIYYLVWFLADRLNDDGRFLGQFEHLSRWRQRIKAIGHGQMHEMSDLEALEIAAGATVQTSQQIDPADPLGLTAGADVGVMPVGGGPEVTGRLHYLSRDRTALMRTDARASKVCVHFPRLDYRLRRLQK